VKLHVALGLLASTTLLAACAELAPLRNPPLLATDDPVDGITTRAEAEARLGPPQEVRASDVGPVLVYRRVSALDATPSRYYGQDQGTRLARYDRLLLYFDPDGRLVRWAIEPE
jgi:hypothetical protein